MQRTSGIVNGNINDLPNLALQFDASANPVLYLGEAIPGSTTAEPVWRISKIDTTTGVVWQWAGGKNSFTNVWDDRATLSYG